MPSLRPIFCSRLTIACCPLSPPRVPAYAPQRHGAPGVAALSATSSTVGTARPAPAAAAVFRKSRLSTRSSPSSWAAMGFGANGSNERIQELNETAEHHTSTVYGKYPSSRLRGVNARHVLLAAGLDRGHRLPLRNNASW